MSDDPPSASPETNARVSVLFLLTLICNIALILFTLAQPTNADDFLPQLLTFLFPIITFVITLLLYTICVLDRAYVVIFTLLVMLSFSLLISLALSFAFPDNNRLNTLSNLFTLNLAFVGFLATTSGVGIRSLRFRRQGRSLKFDFVIESDEDSSTPDTR